MARQTLWFWISGIHGKQDVGKSRESVLFCCGGKQFTRDSKGKIYLPSTPSLSIRAQTSSDHVPQTQQRAQGTRKTVSCRKNIINLHMDKRSSSRWLLVSVQRAATLIKRNDSFIHDTKKSNVIADSSKCYSFKSGQRGKFPFHKRVAAIF